MAIFKNIRFKNILSYGNIFSEIELNNHRVTGITGFTGIGKSTFVDALCFCLFGKPFRNIKKAGLLNYKNKTGLLTEVEFTVKEKKYLVRRGIKPDIFEIYEDDKLLNQNSAVKDYQAILEKNIIGFNYNIFTQIVIVGHATYIPFMRLTSENRRKYVETILGLDVISIMNELHKLNYNDLKTKTNDVKTQISYTQEKIKLLEQYIKKLEDDAKTNKKDQEDRIKRLYKDIKSKLSSIDDEISLCKNDIVDLNKDNIQELQKRLEQLNVLFNKSDIQLDRLIKEKDFYIKNPDKCPSCKQNIPENFKSDVLEKNIIKQGEIESVKNKVLKNVDNTKKKLQEFSVILKNNKQLQEKINLLNSKKNHLLAQKQELIKEKNQIVEKDLSKISDEQNNLDLLQKSYSNLLNLKDEYLTKQEYNDIMSSMLKDSGFKKSIIHKYIGVINESINKYLTEFEFYARFILDEEFNEEILARGINKLSYANFSEGEKLKIDLAIIMTWRDMAKIRTGMSTNLFILDDMINNVDENGIKAIIDILQSLNNINSYLISPSKEVVIENVSDMIYVEQINGFSNILI